MPIWSRLGNAEATIYEEVVVGQIDDGMGGTTAQTEWQVAHEGVTVGFDPETTFEWADVEGEEPAPGGALYVPGPECDTLEGGSRVDVTYRGRSRKYRVDVVRVLESPTGAHGEAVLVTVGDN